VEGEEEGGIWKPTLFEGLLARDIFLINSRPYHLQTNGRMGHFYQMMGETIGYYGSLVGVHRLLQWAETTFYWILTMVKTLLMAF